MSEASDTAHTDAELAATALVDRAAVIDARADKAILVAVRTGSKLFPVIGTLIGCIIVVFQSGIAWNSYRFRADLGQVIEKQLVMEATNKNTADKNVADHAKIMDLLWELQGKPRHATANGN
jgi:hypothetical protein